MPSPARFAAKHVQSLHGYVPGIQPADDGWTKLNTNENPYPPSPRVAEALKAQSADSLRLYPDPRSSSLRRAVARLHGLEEENVIVGNGSDDILNLLVRAFGGSGSLTAFPTPSYSLYPVIVAIENAFATEIPYPADMTLPVEELAQSNARLMFVTSPNAPTGVGIPTATLRELASQFDGLLVIDEAYAEFADEHAVGLIPEFPNIVVTRTLSKSHSLAGLRVGFGLGHPDTIEILDRVRDSYNVSRLSQAAALAAVEDVGYTAEVAGRIRRTRDASLDRFRRLGWFTHPSQANFIFTEPARPSMAPSEDTARDCFDFLTSRKILVRHFPSHALTRSFLRITVGTDSQMETLFEATESWLKNA